MRWVLLPLPGKENKMSGVRLRFLQACCLRKTGFLLILPVLTILFSLCRPSETTSSSLYQEQRTLMGTEWRIQALPSLPGEFTKTRAAVEAAFQEVARIEALMSEWRPDSPLSAINEAAGGEPVQVPEELAALIKRAKHWGALSQGAFDITWKGMGHLWQFDDSFRVPEESSIRSALSRVDYRAIRIQGNRVGLSRPGMAIGLGGIAKGYAVDQAAETLRGFGIQDFLLDGGGDLYVSGSRSNQPWRIGIRDPRGSAEDLVAVLRGFQGAVVTSGDYERFKIVEGKRFHHIIDPRTGRPADDCRSVTVLAPKAEVADILATAIFVLGPTQGLELAAAEPGVDVLIIDGQSRLWMTEPFQQFAEFTEFSSPVLPKR